MRNPTLVLTGLMLAIAPAAFAQTGINNAGRQLLEALNEALNSPIMLVIGLALAVVGVWVWLVKQEAMIGILMIIGGVIITGIPAIFRGTTTVVTPVIEIVGQDQDIIRKPPNTVNPR